MPIIYENGDLLKSNCDVIIHQCNCFGVMGAGIAKQIKDIFPNAYAVDARTLNGDIKKLGTYSWARCSNRDSKTYPTKIVCNLYGQYQFGRKDRHTDYEAVAQGLNKIKDHFLRFQEWPKIGLPYLMSCGLAGGDWNVVSAIIESVFQELPIYVYILEG